MAMEMKDTSTVLEAESEHQKSPSSAVSESEIHARGLPTHSAARHTISGGTPLPKWRSALLHTSLCLALLLSVMDLTIVTTALYTVALDFGSLAGTYWIILAYSLTELGNPPHTAHCKARPDHICKALLSSPLT